ncbi:MAG: BlaI/MecI/CopY family transcriptional regulator [Bryobacteraceae bacterium]|jgi:predicted transcriptional regulator
MLNIRRQPKPLSGLEHLAMQFLWAHGPASAEQVREALALRRPLKDSTVRTILRRLEGKGYLTHRVEGRTYIYAGLEAPQSVAAGAVRQIIDRFCGGSLEQLLVGMVNNDVVDERELQRLAQRIARRKKRED